jgi:ATP-dependent helicase/nuclease subunit B
MDYEQFSASARESVFVTRDELSAARWEAFLLARSVPGSGAATRSLPLLPLPRFVANLWEQSDALAGDVSLLRDGQSRALWKKTIAESRLGSELISHDVAAGWCHDAWRRLGDWGIDWKELRSSEPSGDFDAFLGWCREYSERLRERHWIDGAMIAGQLETLPRPETSEIVLLDPDEPTPSSQRYLNRIRSEGARVEIKRSPQTGVDASSAVFADPTAELENAMRWCVESSLDSGPVALVVSELDSRRSEIESFAAQAIDELAGSGRHPSDVASVWICRGPSLADLPVFGAALAALEMLSGGAGFPSLSRWLRSPFFVSDDPNALMERALLEAELRGTLLAQWPVAEAFRAAGLADRIRSRLPEVADRLGRAFDRLDQVSGAAAPTQWVAAWLAALTELGWDPAARPTTPEMLRSWDAAVESFAGLSVVVGRVGPSEALDTFSGIARTTRVTARVPRNGVHVFERLDQVGPGYGAAWATGMTEPAWPQRPLLNPMLSRRLQVANLMPLATPALAYEASRTALQRFVARVPEVVLSAPARVDDAEAGLSAMVELVKATPLRGTGSGRKPFGAGAAAGSPALERVEDPAPPRAPGLVADATRLLETQARCPLRAFCEFRLGARPLERVRRGLPAAVRGIAIHRALEGVLAPFAATDQFVDLTEARARAGASVDRALHEIVRWQRPPWATIVSLERARSVGLIDELLDKEASRTPFWIYGLEESFETRIGRWVLRGRIDRIDRLQDGRLVIFDYKTGSQPTRPRWFSERLVAPQLPLYAIHFRSSLAGIAWVSLTPERIAFQCAGRLPDDFPGAKRADSDQVDWARQIDGWHEQLAMLLEEYGAGDTRLFDADTALAEGDFAPLTQVHAAAADHAGAVRDDG